MKLHPGADQSEAIRWQKLVRVTQDDLAKLVGVARATPQRALDELARAGAIETGYRGVTIADRVALGRYVNQQ